MPSKKQQSLSQVRQASNKNFGLDRDAKDTYLEFFADFYIQFSLAKAILSLLGNDTQSQKVLIETTSDNLLYILQQRYSKELWSHPFSEQLQQENYEAANDLMDLNGKFYQDRLADIKTSLEKSHTRNPLTQLRCTFLTAMYRTGTPLHILIAAWKEKLLAIITPNEELTSVIAELELWAAAMKESSRYQIKDPQQIKLVVTMYAIFANLISTFVIYGIPSNKNNVDLTTPLSLSIIIPSAMDLLSIYFAQATLEIPEDVRRNKLTKYAALLQSNGFFDSEELSLIASPTKKKPQKQQLPKQRSTASSSTSATSTQQPPVLPLTSSGDDQDTQQHSRKTKKTTPTPSPSFLSTMNATVESSKKDTIDWTNAGLDKDYIVELQPDFMGEKSTLWAYFDIAALAKLEKQPNLLAYFKKVFDEGSTISSGSSQAGFKYMKNLKIWEIKLPGIPDRIEALATKQVIDQEGKTHTVQCFNTYRPRGEHKNRPSR